MDKNTIIGFVLIGLLIIGWSIFNMPSQEEVARKKVIMDSIAQVQKERTIEEAKLSATQPKDSAQFSLKVPQLMESKSGGLFGDAVSQEEFITLENDVMKVTLTNKGGRVYRVELKKYLTWDKKPVVLFDGEQNSFSYFFFTGNNQQISTGDIYFKPIDDSVFVSDEDSSTLRLRAYLSPTRYMEQSYTIRGGSYLIDYHFNLVGIDSIIQSNVQYINLAWKASLKNSEKNITDNRTYSTAFYKFRNEEASSLSVSDDDEKKLTGIVDWISFKEHFFNAALLSSSGFEHGTVRIKNETDSQYVKTMSADLILPYHHEPNMDFAMQFYFGPNSYSDLRKMQNGMDEIVPLGWGIFSWFATPVNKYLIIPTFNFLSRFSQNWGLIILIMTILIKVILMPLTYKSLLSAAKMKVIKPEIDELREKYKGDQSKFGQEQLKLFQKAGVNPLGGCMPILLQLPILVAMYSFFPSSIELRQQSFLWATDLSTFDSIWDFPNHFEIPFYGDHVSLFTLLMTVSQIGSAVYNNQLNSVTGQMKWMQYIFPIMLLGIFNNFSAALTYYYFLSNVITLGQQWLVQTYIIDHEKIHRQIQERKKNPTKKKAGFMARLEEMQRKQQQQTKNRK